MYWGNKMVGHRMPYFLQKLLECIHSKVIIRTYYTISYETHVAKVLLFAHTCTKTKMIECL